MVSLRGAYRWKNKEFSWTVKEKVKDLLLPKNNEIKDQVMNEERIVFMSL